MPRPHTSAASVARLALTLAALGWAMWATGGLWAQVARHSARVVDFLPLWLGGRALLYRMDPTDPAVLRAVYALADLPMRPGGFKSYYPQSAALLSAPLGYLDYRHMARGLQVVLGACLLGGAALGAVASGRQRLLTAALVVGTVASLKITWILINIGQSNALLVLLTGVGLWALSRPTRAASHLGGIAIGLGVAIKLFPVVLLLPALLGRRWRLAAIGLSTPLALLLASLSLYAGPWAGSPLGGGASWFIDPGMHPGWAVHEPAPVMALWQARLWGVGALTLGVTAWVARRPDPALIPALAALWLAWVGTVMAGSAMPHQVIVLLPALGWVLAWPLSAPAGRERATSLPMLAMLVAVLLWRGVFVEHRAGSLQWLPVGYALSLASAARALLTRSRA